MIDSLFLYWPSEHRKTLMYFIILFNSKKFLIWHLGLYHDRSGCKSLFIDSWPWNDLIFCRYFIRYSRWKRMIFKMCNFVVRQYVYDILLGQEIFGKIDFDNLYSKAILQFAVRNYQMIVDCHMNNILKYRS